MYGDDANRHSIVNGSTAVPASAQGLVHELHEYSD
jgi:hypothetical protein